MLCTVKKTLETVVSTGNNAVIQLKSNQKKLFNEVKILSDELKTETKYSQPIIKAHGRRESRKAEVVSVPEYLGNNLERWKYIKAIIKITRFREKYNAKKKILESVKEESFYISTINLKAKNFCNTIQDHWKIENLNHYIKDVAFKEDLSRIRINPANYVILRSFATNILRNNNIVNISEERFLNCCDFKRIFNYKDLS